MARQPRLGRVVVVACAAATACGRIGFDAQGGAALGDGGGVGGHDGRVLGPDAAYAMPAERYMTSTTGNGTVNVVPQVMAHDLALVAVTTAAASTTVVNVTDESGNTYGSANTRATDGSGDAEIWFAENVREIDGVNITITLSGNADAQIWAFDVSGLAAANALDQVQTSSGPISGTASAPTVITTLPNEFIFGLVHVDSDGFNGSAQMPYMSTGQQTNGEGAYMVAGAAGMYAGPTFLAGAGSAACGITVSFRPAAL